MGKKWFAVIAAIFGLGMLLGFRTSYATGIQPGYFEKQEAPAYGVSDDAKLGSEFGEEYEKHFKELYEEKR